MKIKAGIIGGAGYTGGELIRLLLNHPACELVFVHSKSQAGEPLYNVHRDLMGETELKFSKDFNNDIDVLFLCNAHNDSKKFLAENAISEKVKIIDLSQDFRLISNSECEGRKFVYGLPEYNKTNIKEAQNIANPGCFATAIQLALLPLAKQYAIKSEIHISAITGSTGAGQAMSPTTHFSWRENNLSVYKPFTHQHLNEIKQGITTLQNNMAVNIHFIPYRGPFTRGIFASVYTDYAGTEEDVMAVYQEYYQNHPFVSVCNGEIDLKQVVNTNKCVLSVQKHGDKLLITSAIDNLLKGASGQAVQNMNLVFGLPETEGLHLKSTAF